MNRIVILLVTLLIGGCVGDGSSPRTSSSSSSPDELHPKQMCESTSIGGEPKTVCY